MSQAVPAAAAAALPEARVPRLSEHLARFRDTLGYDVLARAPLVLWFGFVGWNATRAVLAEIGAAGAAAAGPWFALDCLARLAGVGFIACILVALCLRRRPVARAPGLRPRLVAFFGTFSITLVALLPPVEMPPGVAVLSLGLIVVGYAFACYALAHLGRSLSMMAEARRLVTSGPYRLVRHPLYAAEAIASVGLLLQFLSPLALALWACHITLQLRRMHYEEAILRRTFPEYEGYARRVARVLPGIH